MAEPSVQGGIHSVFWEGLWPNCGLGKKRHPWLCTVFETSPTRLTLATSYPRKRADQAYRILPDQACLTFGSRCFRTASAI